ncbi:lysophospholipid acyltransferase family protein [Nocardia bovistercoris]|nr:lysophospholipid acyltransferase family protein [Nocardia bovistercoris]
MRITFGPDDLRRVDRLVAPMRAWFSPRFYGLDNIPAEGPVLLVANHSMIAFDCGLLMTEIMHRHGRVVRGLGDHALMDRPAIRRAVQRIGGVRGTRENMRILLSRGEIVLVLPGGSAEAIRRKHERYALKWKGRTGFAEVAIETGARIVPVAMVGANDAYDVVVDGEHPLMWPMRWYAARRDRSAITMPIFRGLGPTLIPKPQRFYYSFGEPIDATRWRGAGEGALELQSAVRVAVEKEFAFLFAERDQDPGRTMSGRGRQALSSYVRGLRRG